jgi:hypothetical protein
MGKLILDMGSAYERWYSSLHQSSLGPTAMGTTAITAPAGVDVYGIRMVY